MVPPAELDFEIPFEFPSRVPRVGGGVASGADGDDGVDSASRGLGLRYKANIFPE